MHRAARRRGAEQGLGPFTRPFSGRSFAPRYAPHASGHTDDASTARELRYSYDDYLRALEESPFKLEYSAGVIYAMAGATLAHGELSVRVASLLTQRLGNERRACGSDVKVRVGSSDFAAA